MLYVVKKSDKEFFIIVCINRNEMIIENRKKIGGL